MRPRARRLSPLAALLGVVAVCCVSAIAYTALRRAAASHETALHPESSPPPESPSASGEPAAGTPAEDEPEPEPPAPNDPPAGDLPAPVPAPSPAPTAEPFAAASASAPAAPSSTQPAPRVNAEQIRAAMQRVPITLYTTTWCKHCERARSWMRANSIRFTEHDVEASPSAERAQKALNPRGGVPTIDIDGQVLVGFDEASVLRALVKAAERRAR